jgi:gamma-glutamylcyclotransferase
MYYFAYASNLNRKQMAERAPLAKPGMSATLPNYRVVFSGYSRPWHGATATIQPAGGDKVMGGLYEVSENDLARLDRFEGVPTEYKRLIVRVFTDMGQVEAVTYIRSQSGAESKPSPEYLAVIRKGYEDWGLF